MHERRNAVVSGRDAWVFGDDRDVARERGEERRVFGWRQVRRRPALACASGDLKSVEMLIDAGADVNAGPKET